MPYRRLPNTDAARIKALKTAIDKAHSTAFHELAIAPVILATAKSTLIQFEKLHATYQQSYDTQVQANKTFKTKIQNVRMFISHFIQVLYMCVMRGEIKEEHLELYGLENTHFVVPDLTTNEQLAEWGEKILEGEQARVAKGGAPIYNPSAARLNVMYSQFKDGHYAQKLHQKTTAALHERAIEYRDVVDNVIFDIWEQVEKYNLHLPVEERYDKNREYGLIYYYRKGEIEKGETGTQEVQQRLW